MNMRSAVSMAILVLGSAVNGSAAICTWTNASGDGDWYNVSNWSGGALPTSGDIANVAVSGETTLTITNDVKVAMFWTSGSGALTIEPGADGAGSISADWGSGAYRQAVLSNAVSTVYNVPVKLRATNYQVYPSFAANAVFNGKVTFTGGAVWIPAIKTSGLVVQFNGEVDAEGQELRMSDTQTMSCTYRFYGKVTAQRLGQDNNSGNTIELYGTGSAIGTLAAERYGKVNLKTANALSALTVLQVGANDKGGIVNVSGAEQVANRLTAVSAYVSAATGENTYCVKATDACTLTLKGSANAVTTTGLTGPLSLVWDPVDDFTQAFTNRTVATSGSITVKRGAVALTGTSSAPSLKRIDVRAGAAFRFQTSVAAPLTSGKCAATVEAGGVIEVAEGVTASFADVMYAGKHQRLGTYAALDAEDVGEGVRKVAWVTGAGRVEIVEGTTFYWTGETGLWSDGASWTSGKAPDATATEIVLDAVSDGDVTLTVDAPVTLSKPMTVRNGGSGRSVLAVASSARVDIATVRSQMMDVGVGGQILVPAGGRLTLDGTGLGINRDYTFCRIDGGELKVTGGTVSFTNCPSFADVCGTSAHTGRVTMTSGDISFRGNHSGQTDELTRIRFLEHSLADFSGGTYRLITETKCQRTLGDGGRIIVTNAVLSTLDSPTSDLKFGSGETTLAGASGVLRVGRSDADMTVAPTDASLPASLTVTDAATVEGAFHSWTIGSAAGRSRFVWATDAALNAGYCLCVGCRAGFGQCDIRSGLVTMSFEGLQIAGTPGKSPYALEGMAEGVLRITGGALNVQGRDSTGYAVHFSGLSVGDGTFTTLTGTDRPLKGTLELSGGVVTNTDSHVMIGGGFAEGAWKQSGGALVDKKDLWIGAAGGRGVYELSGGTASVAGRLYVGGMDTNRSAMVKSMVASGYWPTFRHDAEGTLVVSGGAMTVTGDGYVGYDGSGCIEMDGADGNLTVASLTLANGNASTVKFTAGADGVSPIAVTGKLTVSEGAKLVVDLTAAPESVTKFPLISCKSTEGLFAEGDITLIGKDLKLVQTPTGVSVRRQTGLVLVVY